MEAGHRHLRCCHGNNDRFVLKNHWNRLKNSPLGYSPDWAEKKITEIDGSAAGTMKGLVGGGFPEDVRALASLIGFMTQRQPMVHKEMLRAHSNEVESWSDDWRLIVSLNAALSKGSELVPL